MWRKSDSQKLVPGRISEEYNNNLTPESISEDNDYEQILTDKIILKICQNLRTRSKMAFLSANNHLHSLKNQIRYHKRVNIDKIKNLWYFDQFINVIVGNYSLTEVSKSSTINFSNNIFMTNIGEDDRNIIHENNDGIYFNRGIRIIDNTLYIGTHKNKKIKIIPLPRFIGEIYIGCLINKINDEQFLSIWTNVIHEPEYLEVLCIDGVVIEYNFKNNYFHIANCIMRRKNLINKTKTKMNQIRRSTSYTKGFARLAEY